jgi:hypothetical protein
MRKFAFIAAVVAAAAGIAVMGLGVSAPTDVAARTEPTRSESNSPAAQTACEGITGVVSGSGKVDRLAGAFVVPAADLVGWQDTRYGPNAPRVVGSQWSKLPPSSPLTVCFFDGTFGGFTKPPTVAAQVYDRIVMIIDSAGQPYLDTAGFRATTLVEIPRRKP